MSEILAPAGDEQSFFAALNSGADAVYLGLQDFSARKSAANFSLENLSGYISRAHVLGVKVYVALNTLVKDGELDGFFAYALGAWNAGADALILQDIFLGKLLKRTYPEMILHLSTQAGVCNVYGARLAKRYGFSRVILARETPIEDIRAIASEMETEAFVQGALCTCFSGQCYMSSLIGGNSGNRGFCKQPCRKKYSVDRKGAETLSYALSLSDLCVGKDIFDLAEAGVVSFKIEGRLRSAAYVGAAVKYYKDLLAEQGNRVLRSGLSDLKRAFNRGDYTKGYVFGQDKNLLSRNIQGHKGETVGVVDESVKNERFTFVRSNFSPSDGDGFKVIRKGVKEVGGGEYRTSFPQGKGGFYLPKNVNYRDGDEVYLTLDTGLARRVAARKKCVSLTVSGRVAEGKAPEIELAGPFGKCTVRADFIAEQAKSRPFTREEFIACFSKTDDFPFEISFGNVEIQGDCFIVKSALNAVRRQAFSLAYDKLAGKRERIPARPVIFSAVKELDLSPKTAVIDRDFSSQTYVSVIDDAIFKPKNYKDRDEIESFLKQSEKFARRRWLYLPAYCTGKDLAEIDGYVGQFDGVYGEGVYSLEYCRTRGLKLFAGTGFNLFNRASVGVLREERPAEIALSKELSSAEIEKTGEKGAFVFAGGKAKAMELGHCLFGKTCAGCDKKDAYVLTDEDGRRFPLLRYKNSHCRFEVYNSASLTSEISGARLFDFSALTEAEKREYLQGGLKNCFGNYTSGALKNGIR